MESRFNILILRGFARQQKHWPDFIKTLESSDSIHQVLGIDLPGFGSQRQKTSPRTIHEIFLDVKEIFDAKKDESLPWVCLGLSLGAMVLLEWAKESPEDFKKFFILNTSSRDVALPWQRFNLGFITDFIKKHPLNSYEAESVVLSRISNFHGEDRELIDRWGKIAENNPVKASNVLCQLEAAFKYKSPDKLNAEVVFLASENDRLADPISSVKLSKRYNAPIRVHLTAGHELTLDDPKWVTQKVEEFL